MYVCISIYIQHICKYKYVYNTYVYITMYITQVNIKQHHIHIVMLFIWIQMLFF